MQMGRVSECLAVDAKSKDSRRYEHIQPVWELLLNFLSLDFPQIHAAELLSNNDAWELKGVTPQLCLQAQVGKTTEQGVWGTPSPPRAISYPLPAATLLQAEPGSLGLRQDEWGLLSTYCMLGTVPGAL